MWVLVKVKKLEDIGIDEERRIYIDKVDVEPHPKDGTVVYIDGRGIDAVKAEPEKELKDTNGWGNNDFATYELDSKAKIVRKFKIKKN